MFIMRKITRKIILIKMVFGLMIIMIIIVIIMIMLTMVIIKRVN